MILLLHYQTVYEKVMFSVVSVHLVEISLEILFLLKQLSLLFYLIHKYFTFSSGNSLTVFVMLRRPFRQMSVSVVLISLSLSDLAVSIMFPFNKMFVRKLFTSDVRTLGIVGCRTFFWAFRLFKVKNTGKLIFYKSYAVLFSLLNDIETIKMFSRRWG